jgi:penicillin amidase
VAEPARRVHRDSWGVIHVRGADLRELYEGLGYAHALDRGLQMLFMRILGSGRVSECLDPGDASVAIDTFFRRMGWHLGLEEPVAALAPESRELIAAYCAGANAAFTRRSPWELKLLGYRPEAWTPADTLLLSRMTGYLTLAQSQAEVERFIVEMVQAGVSREKLEELFPGQLEALDVELLRAVRLGERVVPVELFGGAGARLMASNNWAVAGSRSASGFPLFANDPHLEVNRLPNIWSEVVLEGPGRWAIAATMPGLPGLIAGRNPDLAWGVTYSFLDAVDSWVERCRDGSYWREDTGGHGEWKEFRRRTERILRKGKPPVDVTCFENDHGILDGDPRVEGHYLATRWTAARSGGASLASIARIWSASSAAQAMEILGRVETSWNWLAADRAGSIGFQTSGMLPRRRPGWSGLVPVAGWDPRNDWQGIADPEELPRALDPEDGIFVTSNQDLNRYGKLASANAPMGAWRADRIRFLLEHKQQLTVEDLTRIQADLHSTQAEAFMATLRPLLWDNVAARELVSWDCRYDPSSRGATLFERFYAELQREVFGGHGLGELAVKHLAGETGIFADLYSSFDRVLLSSSSAWYGGESRDAIWRRAAQRALAGPAEPWGASRRVTMSHILFGGKMPRFLGFDRGPITLPGGRATVTQGQIYRSAGRTTTFAPSLRLVTDLGSDDVWTNLAGGPSDRRFSRWYVSDLQRWLAGKYKRLRAKG